MTRRLLSRDPTLVVLAFACWAALSAATFLGPGEAFQIGPSYRALLRLPIGEEAWGVIHGADALLLAATALRGRLWMRAGVAVLSSAIWVFFGVHVLLGGYVAGVFSSVGAWEVLMGLGLAATAVQWIGHAEPPRPTPTYEEDLPWS